VSRKEDCVRSLLGTAVSSDRCRKQEAVAAGSRYRSIRTTGLAAELIVALLPKTLQVVAKPPSICWVRSKGASRDGMVFACHKTVEAVYHFWLLGTGGILVNYRLDRGEGR
jgi:hypothetical protein